MPKRTIHAPVKFFLLAGAVLTVLLGVILLERAVVTGNVPVAAPPELDYASLIPAGASLDPAPPIELFETPVSAHVIAFTRKDTARAELGLVRWDKQRYRYALAGTVELVGADGTGISQVDKLALVPIGAGASSVIVAVGVSGGAYTQGVMLAERGESSLSLVATTDHGALQPAFFFQGASVRHGESFSLTDVSGDGRVDAVQASTETDDAGNIQTAYRVYEFRDGTLEYSQDLSWALQTSTRVFPSPEFGP
jgi:hypothetical protein